MKKKLLVVAGIIVGLIAVVLIGLTLYVKSYLQSDKLKTLIIPRVEQSTGRKINIDAINVSIFSGISVQGVHLKEKDGTKDFVAAKEIVLRYDLMPLLSKKLVISSMQVVDPALNVRRDENGMFNYADIIEHMKAGKKSEASKPESNGGIPFSISADKIGISNAKVEFADARKELPNVTANSDAELKVSTGSEPGALKFAGKVNLKSLDVTMGGITMRTSGTIDIEPEKIAYALSTVIGSDTIATTGSVTNYMTAPDIRKDIYSKHLDLAKLMALAGGAKHEEKQAPPVGHGKVPDGGGKAGVEKKMEIKAAGEIKVDIALYEGNTVRNLVMKYRYSGGVLTIDPLSLNFASGEKVDLSGILKGDLVFHYSPDRGDGAEQIKQTLVGKIVVDLNKVQVKESKIADAIALFTGLDDLRRPVFDKGHFDINIRDQKMLIAGLMTSPRLKVTPSGAVTFNKALDLLTDIEVSPELASKMQVARFTGFLESKDGWRLIPLKITGTTDKPSVGANQATLKKQLQKGIQHEIEKRLFKGDSQQKQQREKQQYLLKGLLGK
jgi:hypothetical protein